MSQNLKCIWHLYLWHLQVIIPPLPPTSTGNKKCHHGHESFVSSWWWKIAKTLRINLTPGQKIFQSTTACKKLKISTKLLKLKNLRYWYFDCAHLYNKLDVTTTIPILLYFWVWYYQTFSWFCWKCFLFSWGF